MNWKLVLQLSLFGLGMAVATIAWIPSKVEPIFWLLIFGICAYIIARRSRKHFWHGFSVSVANSIWITSIHIIFVDSYLANHPEEAAMMATMPVPDSPRLMMLITGPIIGVISGLVLGLFAFVASRIVKKTLNEESGFCF